MTPSMRKVDDAEKRIKGKQKKKEKEKIIIVATNVVASRPPERRPTGTPHARANCVASLSIDSWPPERKDIQLLIIKSRMSLLIGGQLSTGKKGLGFVYIFIVPFPVWTGINFNSISCLVWN